MKFKLLATYVLTAGASIFSIIFVRLIFGVQNYIVIAFITFIIVLTLGVCFSEKFYSEIKASVDQMKKHLTNVLKGETYKSDVGEVSLEFEQLAEAISEVQADIYESKNILIIESKSLKAILDSVSNGIVAVDTSSNILLANTAAKNLFGVNGDILGKYFLEVFFDTRLDRVLQNVINKGTKSAITIHTKLEEPKIFNIEASALKIDDSTIGAVILLQDITELHKLEKMRSDFAANVSHELKTPLTSIKGFVETLLESAVSDIDTTKKFLEIIRIEADRLSRLINDILSLSEIEFKKGNQLSKRINIALILKDTIEMMKTHARVKEISIGHLFASDEVWLNANTDRIKQMAINLIDNAIKYTPHGGSIVVLLEDFGDRIILRVRDTGIGIAKEHIPRIFERFYRVDKGRSRTMGGTGLGLAIVKHIVKSMNGHIEVNSNPGEGTEFAVYIPIRKQ